MKTIDALRNQLIDQILTTKNEDLLQEISKIFNANNLDLKNELNSFQIEMIQMGLKDIENGDTISDSDLEKLDDEWMR